MNRVFFAMLSFMSRLPVPQRWSQGLDTPDYVRGIVTFPVIGLLLGSLSGVVFVLLNHWCGTPLAALFAVLALALLTGGLHLDGLADSADAWMGGHGDRQRTLEIMKDPRSGPAAVSAVVLALLLKFAALAVLLKGAAWPALLAAPVLGRAALPALLLSAPYVRSGGLGAAIAGHLPKPAAIVLLLLTAAGVGFLADGWKALLAAAVLLFLLRRACLARLGGITGDTLGAAVELTEAAVLLALALRF